jgi:hypothetical protein
MKTSLYSQSGQIILTLPQSLCKYRALHLPHAKAPRTQRKEFISIKALRFSKYFFLAILAALRETVFRHSIIDKKGEVMA